MKIDPNYIFVSLSGDPVHDEQERPVILRDVACMALLHAKAEMGLSEKHARWKLAQALSSAASELAISPEDAARIKAATGDIYGPLIVGQLVDLLDG